MLLIHDRQFECINVDKCTLEYANNVSVPRVITLTLTAPVVVDHDDSKGGDEIRPSTCGKIHPWTRARTWSDDGQVKNLV